METLVCLKSQAIPSFSQPTHFRAAKMQLRNHTDRYNTLSTTPCVTSDKLAQEQWPSALLRVPIPDSLTYSVDS